MDRPRSFVPDFHLDASNSGMGMSFIYPTHLVLINTTLLQNEASRLIDRERKKKERVGERQKERERQREEREREREKREIKRRRGG
jgi:hypothetical protein